MQSYMGPKLFIAIFVDKEFKIAEKGEKEVIPVSVCLQSFDHRIGFSTQAKVFFTEANKFIKIDLVSTAIGLTGLKKSVFIRKIIG